MARIKLTFACEDGIFKRPLLDRTVDVQGVDLLTTVAPSSEIFWRQLSRAEFDASELSLSSYLRVSSQRDTRFIALPIFPSRRFFHTNCLIRADRDIERPQDLRGKRVGIPEYQVTSMIWTRSALQDEFGVRPEEIDWWIERTPERSHGGATGFRPPAGVTVHQVPSGSNLGAMVAAGELDAVFSYIATPNAVDRSRIDLARHPDVRPLFADADAEGVRYYRKTGIHPVNHLIVLRCELLDRYPWLALNLYLAFAEARRRVLAEAQAGLDVYRRLGLLSPGFPARAEIVEGRAGMVAPYLGDSSEVSGAVYPYGVRSNLSLLRAVARSAWEQGITERLVEPEDLFAASTLGL